MSASPHIVWTFRARRRLNHALIRRQVHSGKQIDSRAVMTELDGILTLAFPKAKELIVHDQYLGFRAREEEYILLVEVHDDERPGNFVVKVKKDKKDKKDKDPEDTDKEDNDPEETAPLDKELKAWEDCRPAGLRHDLVFMTVDPVRDPEDQLVALLYQDAQQFIGVDRTTSLEEAFLGAVLHGVPTPESVANVLTELFARVGHLLYQGASAVEPKGQRIELNAGKTLETYFDTWARGAGEAVRRRVGIPLPVEPPVDKPVCDPVDFFGFLVYHLEESGEPAAKFIPRMLRGPAHGDLHGRNVLVGIVENEAHWPAVYDYEDMGTNNLLGWDFVKLETELKIRAYQHVFSGKKWWEVVTLIYQFETRLGIMTEAHRSDGNWPAPSGATPEDRLCNLLLVIRRLAGKHLGEAHNRPGEWLDEFYFLLGCYGVYVGKFPNLKDPELIAAFLSAGVAAARFKYSRDKRSKNVEVAP